MTPAVQRLVDAARQTVTTILAPKREYPDLGGVRELADALTAVEKEAKNNPLGWDAATVALAHLYNQSVDDDEKALIPAAQAAVDQALGVLDSNPSYLVTVAQLMAIVQKQLINMADLGFLTYSCRTHGREQVRTHVSGIGTECGEYCQACIAAGQSGELESLNFGSESLHIAEKVLAALNGETVT